MKLIVIETGMIISFGIFMHLYGLSITELRYSKLFQLTPNAASSLFVLSVLCMFTKLRTLWPKTRRMPQRLLVFLLELALILYATEFVLRQIWLPSIKLLNFLCHFLGQYIMTVNDKFLTYHAPQLSNWIRNEAFYVTRFLLAVLTFISMLKITGCVQFIQEKLAASGCYNTVDLTSNEYPYNCDLYSCNLTGPQKIYHLKQRSFDVYDLPRVPQEDILSLSSRIAARQKKSPKAPVRKTKRKTKILFDDESSC